MSNSDSQSDNEFYHKLKWLVFSRVLFTTLLLGSTVVLQLAENIPILSTPLLHLYLLIIGVFLLSFAYALLLSRVNRQLLFAYIQISIDTFIVTQIIFVTGSASSIFSFLYLVVIIYSSMLLFRRGSMIMAALCSIQYGILIDLEYFSIIDPPTAAGTGFIQIEYSWTHVLYKMIITMLACFAVAMLSSLLSEQARRTRKELVAMENHVKRVEKMAAAGEMAAGLAHEVKNPLASLIGAIQLLREDIRYDAEHDKLMQIVLREADRLSSLVNNFLLFARPPSGNPAPIDLEKALIETVELFEKDKKSCGEISIIREVLSGVWIEMDAFHLRQILWNLLLNAAEAIEGAGTIHLKMSPPQNRMVEIEIADTGCGMDQKTLDAIFDPFFTTKPNGTGLGLSIVHSILESYNSWLGVESRANEGAKFTIKFRQIDMPT
ncbi:nitrogen regulation protein NR(II) [Thermodesulfobacteriota bacterium]